MEKQNSSPIADFIDKNYALIQKLELTSFGILLLGYLLFELNIEGFKSVFLLGIGITAVLLILQSFKTFELKDEELIELEAKDALKSHAIKIFINKLYFISLAVSCISLMGFIFEFEKLKTQLYVGGGTLLVVTFVSIFIQMENKSKIYDLKFYSRILICFIFLGILVAKNSNYV